MEKEKLERMIGRCVIPRGYSFEVMLICLMTHFFQLGVFWVLWHCFAVSLISQIDQIVHSIYCLAGNECFILYWFLWNLLSCCTSYQACVPDRLFLDLYILASSDQILTLTQLHWPQVIYWNCKINNLALFLTWFTRQEHNATTYVWRAIICSSAGALDWKKFVTWLESPDYRCNMSIRSNLRSFNHIP